MALIMPNIVHNKYLFLETVVSHTYVLDTVSSINTLIGVTNDNITQQKPSVNYV